MEHLLEIFCRNTAFQFPRECKADLLRRPANTLLGSPFRTIACPYTLRHVSHAIEDTIVEGNYTEVHASFQALSRLTPQINRYEQIARSVMGLWLYGAHDQTPIALPRTAYVDTAGTAMQGYWWIAAWGPRTSLCLVAEEIPCFGDCKRRQYRGFFTTSEPVTFQLLDILRECFPNDVPTAVVRTFMSTPIGA